MLFFILLRKLKQTNKNIKIVVDPYSRDIWELQLTNQSFTFPYEGSEEVEDEKEEVGNSLEEGLTLKSLIPMCSLKGFIKTQRRLLPEPGLSTY